MLYKKNYNTQISIHIKLIIGHATKLYYTLNFNLNQNFQRASHILYSLKYC